MFKRDKHLQNDTALTPLAVKRGWGGEGLVTDRWTELSVTRKM